MYKHGGLTVYHGDCLSLDIEPVDAMITDPPFAPKTHRNARTNKGGQKGGSDLIDFAPLDYDGLVARLEPGQGWEAIVFLHRLNAKGKPGRKKWNGGGRSSVFHHGVCRDSLYPTQKPVALISDFVRLFTNPGGTILDPFCGSGTTLYVAKQLGRNAVGCDKSEKACNIAIERLAQEVMVI